MPDCRLCQAAASFQQVRAEYVFGGKSEHKFWQCGKCDAVYLYPIPTVEEEEYFYRMEFEKFMSKRTGGDRDWSNAEAHIRTNQDQVERRWPVLIAHLKSGMEVLEIGCSSGFMLDAFRRYGLTCTGIEPSGEFLGFLKNKGYNVYERLDHLPAGKEFDVIVHFFVLEHVRDPLEFFKKTYARLKAGGKIIAEIPCVQDPLTALYHIPAFEKFYWSVAHHYYYSPKSLKYILDTLQLSYEIIPEQRYDLSNHVTWMMEGKPGGQGKYNYIFSAALIQQYKEDLKKHWLYDSMFLIVTKKD